MFDFDFGFVKKNFDVFAVFRQGANIIRYINDFVVDSMDHDTIAMKAKRSNALKVQGLSNAAGFSISKIKLVLTASAFVAAIGLVGMTAFDKPTGTPLSWGDPLAHPEWANKGYTEVNLGIYSNRPEWDFVTRRILPKMVGAGHELPAFYLGLYDVAGLGEYQIFLQIVDPAFCYLGCRTLVYAWVEGRWRLEADENAGAILARPGEFVTFHETGPLNRHRWNNASKTFDEIPAVSEDP